MRGAARRVACVAVLLALPAPVAGAAYAPVDQPGPPLSVPAADLRASLACSDDVGSSARPAVLLTPATTVTSAENFGWNWMPALRAAGFPVCTTDLPGAAGQNMQDMQTRAEYVVYAIRRVHELSGGRRIAIVGHSQGGMIMRWPLRFWPDTRAMVADVVGMAGTNHGSTTVPWLCRNGCAPALWQQRDDSAWTAALNSGQETFAGIDYTEIYSRTDEFVTPASDDTGTSSLHGPGRITNVAVQDVCPADVNEHLLVGTVDPAAWQLGLDALTHDGPADPARIDADAACSAGFMPGVSTATGPASLAGAAARVASELALAPKSDAEPPLRCYVTATCPPTAVAPIAATAAPARTCRARTVTVRIRTGGRALRSVRVTLNGKRVRATRRGRATLRVVLAPRAGRQVVRVHARLAGGRRVTVVRSLSACAS